MGFHGKVFSEQELEPILKELEKKFYQATHYDSPQDWQPQMPTAVKEKKPKTDYKILSDYKLGEKVATRKAFGQALNSLGKINENIVVLDGDVQNSTFTDIFANSFPERFYECFVAEQNMIGMAIGMVTCKKQPLAATFASFLSRAHDQFRMAAISKSTLKVCGSHAGASIGQDGPSQMGLEDISMMRSIPDSIIFYPCDGTSTVKLLSEIFEYNKGIGYLRTTRTETPIIYDDKTEFKIGGFNILQKTDKDVVSIVAAGITVFEALKAYTELKKEGISSRIIDCYSVKPIDGVNLGKTINDAGKKVVSVEDHYIQGGLGEALCVALKEYKFDTEILAVKEVPFSGKPSELLEILEIDYKAIIKTVKKLLKK